MKKNDEWQILPKQSEMGEISSKIYDFVTVQANVGWQPSPTCWLGQTTLQLGMMVMHPFFALKWMDTIYPKSYLE